MLRFAQRPVGRRLRMDFVFTKSGETNGHISSHGGRTSDAVSFVVGAISLHGTISWDGI